MSKGAQIPGSKSASDEGSPHGHHASPHKPRGFCIGVIRALELAIFDLTIWTDGLTDAEIHSAPHGLTPVAFHLRHLAHSTDRILTYAEGSQLSDDQIAALKLEQSRSVQAELESLAQLLAEVESSFSNATERICNLSTANFDTPCMIGRKQLPTTLGGALIHVADHAQRHTGQVVTTAKLLKALREGGS